jgi:ornithine cyclodeaminase/alanine dehydrogenase-like protein (mu-crystallin family)
MLVLTAQQVKRLLDMRSCIDAVEAAFRARGLGGRAGSAVAGVALEDGKLHAKLATLDGARSYAVTKINANIPGNPSRRGLPTIQGVVALFDAVTGTPLALMDSGLITAMRTAAASAVAAKWLALENAYTLAVIGCGIQARAHVEALLQVRPIRRLRAYDLDSAATAAFCSEMRSAHGVDCASSTTVHEATAGSAIVVTTTPSKQPIIGLDDVDRGTFIAAVGADSEDKQELSVDLLRSAVIVVDDIDQCARIGDLHHAIHAGAMTISEVRASLDEVVSQRIAGRRDDSEIIIFDSTGVAIEDAAAAAVVYDKAQAAGVGTDISLGGIPPAASITDRSSS